MDEYIGTQGFTSRAEVAKCAIREFIDRNPLKQRFERVNADTTGCKILDRKLPRKPSYTLHSTITV